MQDERYVYEALARFNYFPNQKQGVGEIPPIFSSRRFTPEVIELIVLQPDSCDERAKDPASTKASRPSKGFDFVEYSSTRYNNVPRILGIPHPLAYGRLAKCIADNWSSICKICDNESSKIKPDAHVDGRLVIMNYEGFREKILEKSRKSFGKRFLVNTDVSGCFNSVYTHAIEWAGLGAEEAKKRLGGNGGGERHWSQELDRLQRNTRRLETQGITIGPGTSTVVVEIILSVVDECLRAEGYDFARYVDDYVCYCADSSEAERFLQKLSLELKKFKFALNLSKTKVESLPVAIQTDWIANLHAALPARTGNDQKYSAISAINYLEYAIALNGQTPDGSVLKFAMQQVVYGLDKEFVDVFVDYLINLSWHYPLLLPYIGVLFEQHELQYVDYEDRLNQIIVENSLNFRSDGMCWALYFVHKYGLALTDAAKDGVLASCDCLSLCVLMKITGWTDGLQEVVTRLDGADVYQKDQLWLFLYQAFYDGHIDNPYNSKVFDLMRSLDVDFMPAVGVESTAENYCVYLIFEGALGGHAEILSFEDFIKKKTE